jgi:uncharacterized protein (DUF111 family)
MRLEAIGLGAGNRDPATVSNVVRVLLGSPVDALGSAGRSLAIVEANVDDLAPELVPDAIEALLAAGALDAWSTPIVVKRGARHSRYRRCAIGARSRTCTGRSSRAPRLSAFVLIR